MFEALSISAIEKVKIIEGLIVMGHYCLPGSIGAHIAPYPLLDCHQNSQLPLERIWLKNG
eukprot:5613333-Amphidinium_carterae.1